MRPWRLQVGMMQETSTLPSNAASSRRRLRDSPTIRAVSGRTPAARQLVSRHRSRIVGHSEGVWLTESPTRRCGTGVGFPLERSQSIISVQALFRRTRNCFLRAFRRGRLDSNLRTKDLAESSQTSGCRLKKLQDRSPVWTRFELLRANWLYDRT